MSQSPNPCPNCLDLTPASDEGRRISLAAIARTATAGCDSCRLVRHAVNFCVPQALESQKSAGGTNVIDVVIQQAIMRHFVEVVVKWDGNKSAILDLLVEPSE
jgi:hypothetical protein